MEDLVAHCNVLRQAKDLLGIEQLMALSEIAVTIHDPFATLIGKNVTLGSGNCFGPGGFTASTMAEGETLRIGDHGRYTDGAAIQAFGLFTPGAIERQRAHHPLLE